MGGEAERILVRTVLSRSHERAETIKKQRDCTIERLKQKNTQRERDKRMSEPSATGVEEPFPRAV